MINRTLQDFFSTVSEHLKKNDLLEDETIAYVLGLLNNKKRHETIFSAYIVDKQLRIRVSVFGSEPKRLIKLPVFKLIRHTYRADTDGFMLDKRRNTIGELVLDAVSEREEPYRYKHGQFKVGDIVCRITKEGKYLAGLMYEEFTRDRYSYIHMIDDGAPFCCPGSIMEDISWCKKVVLAGTKDLSYLNTMKKRESKEELDDLIRRDIGHIIKANFEWDRFQELNLDIEDEISKFVKLELKKYTKPDYVVITAWSDSDDNYYDYKGFNGRLYPDGSIRDARTNSDAHERFDLRDNDIVTIEVDGWAQNGSATVSEWISRYGLSHNKGDK